MTSFTTEGGSVVAERVKTKKLQPPSAAALMKRRIDPRVSRLDQLEKRESFLDQMIDKKVAHAERVLRFYDKSAHRLI
jgi:hypothetical protein